MIRVQAVWRVKKRLLPAVSPALAVAIAFAREGADVLIFYLDEHEDAQDTARLVEVAGQKAMIPSDMPVERVKNFGSEVPLQRAGQPAELALTHVMLASDEASYISGATLAVTGGVAII
ncbi:SDR family oxidoreductase [Pantoea vagans]|uniref:SDR family oxidoreductase n=1 Tax=Pantoea vagans TaxID=470934 RepID=UPI003AFB061F